MTTGHANFVRIKPHPQPAVVQEGYTALHLAASQGQHAMLQLLLERGAAPNARTAQGHSPLHYAAEKNHSHVAQALLAARPDGVHLMDDDGDTPLHWAAHYGHAQVARTLLEAAADPHARNRVVSK
jgi:ankyrin repeat protein